MAKIRLNELPVNTFGSMKVNYVEKDIDIKNGKEPVFEVPDGVSLERTGLSNDEQKLSALLRDGNAWGYSIRGNSEKPVLAEIGDSSFCELTVTVPENAQLTVIIFAETEKALVRTVVNGGAYSHAKVVQVFRGGSTVNQTEFFLADGAKGENLQLYYGGMDSVSGTKAVLTGRGAEFDYDIGYHSADDDRLDVSLNMIHTGSRTVSSARAGGVLEDRAAKTFKGTIDFKKGAKGAKGSEQEDVMLMSESVRNKTVPLILCEEEDVDGVHGATIGRLDGGTLFYLQSRGLSVEEIYRLIARSKLTRVIEKIGHSETSERIKDSIL